MSVVFEFIIKGNETIIEVLKDILKKRIVSRYQIEIEIEKGKIELADKQLSEILDYLKDSGLIDKRKGKFEELDRYFPTAKGLEIEKEII